VVFDRNGYVYQANNRVGVLADGARKAGLNF
jgi:ribosomal protein L18